MSKLIQGIKKSKDEETKDQFAKVKKFQSLEENSKKYFDQIVSLINSQVELDFTNYRDNYLNRRLVSRLNGIPEVKSYKEYLKYLQKNLIEESSIFQEMFSIHVTDFFRDNSPFRYLEKILINKIVAQKKSSSDKTIRILSAPCSTGEEPYSFAIIMDFLKQKKKLHNPVEILGTDIDYNSVQSAKKGKYKSEKLKNISQKSIARNFRVLDDEYVEIKDRIKKYCTFEIDDITKMTNYKPKFDLIACRNFLIYISKKKQKTCVQNLIENLVPNGYIMFGKSEGQPLLRAENLIIESSSEHIYQYRI
ncbi:MAG: hypothetical protein GY870_22695 [archaeon]|nr:hypothetical protein [archaeon]